MFLQVLIYSYLRSIFTRTGIHNNDTGIYQKSGDFSKTVFENIVWRYYFVIVIVIKAELAVRLLFYYSHW